MAADAKGSPSDAIRLLVNEYKIPIDISSSHGITPLMYSSSGAIVRELVSLGIFIFLYFSYFHVFMFAPIQLGASVKARDKNGDSVLHCANVISDVMKTLVEAGFLK